MKVGDLVTVMAHGKPFEPMPPYLVTGELGERNRALGRQFELFSFEEGAHVVIHEKWIRVVE